MRKCLFRENRIQSKRLRSRKGASVVFALVGFMFAAMVSFVVINAAYSAASRVKKLKYDEQSFLLAQSMSGIIAEALSGSGGNVTLPNGTQVKSPDGDDLKYDALTLNYQYIEQKNPATPDDGTLYKYYNGSENGTSFLISTSITDPKKKTFYEVVKGKTSLSAAGTAVQALVREMARKIDQGEDAVTEKLTTQFTNPSNEQYDVVTVFQMDSSYSINAVTTAIVRVGGVDKSKYIVRMDAGAAVRTDKLVCVGTKNVSAGTITAQFGESIANDPGEELVKVSCYSVTWPPEQIRNVYVAP